jgi:hypothetical protein
LSSADASAVPLEQTGDDSLAEPVDRVSPGWIAAITGGLQLDLPPGDYSSVLVPLVRES